MAKVKCPKCRAEVWEIDCLDFEITDDDVILEKWGKCTECRAEIVWNELVPNNPIIKIVSVE